MNLSERAKEILKVKGLNRSYPNEKLGMDCQIDKDRLIPWIEEALRAVRAEALKECLEIAEGHETNKAHDEIHAESDLFCGEIIAQAIRTLREKDGA